MKTVNNQYTVKGFTLLELMIVVAIIGIIAAIAYPSYMNSVRKSNRADAKAALNDAAQQMQRCYTLNSSYSGCDSNIATTSPEEFYTIGVNATDTTYTLTATAAKKPQTDDTNCATFTLNHLGAKTPDPDTDTYRCW